MRPKALIYALGSTLLFLAADVHAGVAWGDASLKSDDVRIEVDTSGRAEVTHTVGLHVAAKKFRAFVVEGVDATIEPPPDDATLGGRDGPGWPIAATDSKGQPIEAFAEPAGGPGKLRVRFGPEGVGRGEYTVRIRYRVDLVKHGTFVREGAMAKLAWATPRWPEGYDGAHFVFAFPSATAEPRVSIADLEGDGEHPTDGVAVVAIHRSTSRDEVEITRPHVPQGESTRFVLRVDPKAFPAVASLATPTEAREPSIGATDTKRGRSLLVGAAAFAAFALGLVLRKRDVAASTFRPLVPISGVARATVYAACSGGAILATFGGRPLFGACAVVGAIACATLRAPAPPSTARGPGRWLAIPEQGIPEKKRTPVSPLDGRALPLAALVVIAIAAFALGRHELRAAIALLMVAAPLVPLFATGRAAQLPPDRVADAWAPLSRIAAALRARGHAAKIVARTGSTIDEIRLRLEGTRNGVRNVEIGCAIVHASGGTALVPEVLVRLDDGSAAARAAIRHAEHARDAVMLLGRSEGERVLAIRPADVAPEAIASSAEAALALGVVEKVENGAAKIPARAASVISNASNAGGL